MKSYIVTIFRPETESFYAKLVNGTSIANVTKYCAQLWPNCEILNIQRWDKPKKS